MGKKCGLVQSSLQLSGGTPWWCYHWTPVGTRVGSDSYWTHIGSLFQLDCSCFEIFPPLWRANFLGPPSVASLTKKDHILLHFTRWQYPQRHAAKKSSLLGAKLRRQRCNLTYLKVGTAPCASLPYRTLYSVLQWVKTVVSLLLPRLFSSETLMKLSRCEGLSSQRPSWSNCLCHYRELDDFLRRLYHAVHSQHLNWPAAWHEKLKQQLISPSALCSEFTEVPNKGSS